MMINQANNNNVKDVIISPKGGAYIIFNDNTRLYKPSEEYINKYYYQRSLLYMKLNYSQIRLKRIRDNKVLLKYIIPEMFRKIKLVMPRFDTLNQKY